MIHVGQRPFPAAPAREQHPCLARRAQGDAVEPVGQEIAAIDGVGLANEHEERRLERILRGVYVGQHPAADAQYHRPMPLQQQGERRFLAVNAEALQ